MRQYVWLVRYGLTEHALVEGVGPYDSDIDPTVGLTHAKAIAERISASLAAVPDVVYSDPFLRCAHTAAIIVKSIYKNGEKKHRIEEGITEWLVPSLLVDLDGEKTDPRSTEELYEIFPENMDLSYCSVNPVVLDGTPRDKAPVGAPLFIETESDLFLRCATSVGRILNDLKENQNVCIVSHAPCNQAMALFLEGKKDPKESSFGPWSLGGLTRFSRTVENGVCGKWDVDFYSNTDHMPGEYKEGLKGQWSLPSFVHK